MSTRGPGPRAAWPEWAGVLMQARGGPWGRSCRSSPTAVSMGRLGPGEETRALGGLLSGIPSEPSFRRAGMGEEAKETKEALLSPPPPLRSSDDRGDLTGEPEAFDSFLLAEEAPSTASSTPDSTEGGNDDSDFRELHTAREFSEDEEEETTSQDWGTPRELTFSYIAFDGVVGSGGRRDSAARRPRPQGRSVSEPRDPPPQPGLGDSLESIPSLSQSPEPGRRGDPDVAPPTERPLEDLRLQLDQLGWGARGSGSGEDSATSSSTPLEDEEPEGPEAGGAGKVVDLLYWKDTKTSGGVFTGLLASLLCLLHFSIVSVAAHVALLLLCGTISLRVYRKVLQAVHRGDGANPFQAYLDVDLTLTREQTERLSQQIASRVVSAATQLRHFFLVEDLVDSLKLALLFYILTFVGAVFNGLTLLILGVIGLFTIPLLYWQHQVSATSWQEASQTWVA
ncbi:Reticulon-2 [Galemys pyrenaicus]|uniref:Reticulon n=1 Tax=Galemys pyrenaicus TaxID=202257 RepID=A0A8J6DPU0_GALPY|nr:Reticulon-2 [Galemys pyrenaicus]